ncbi:MAG: PAS domain-containing sensor histidine kinase, partial [Bacteroidales bacterium]|nr:PAS domain-containing sensor histidine kinase [Bacteroidales bacterium]
IKVDITQQKHYEEKLIAAQHYLNSIFQALPVLLLITTPDGLITEVMAHDELLLYAERQHIINRKVNEIFPPEKAQLFESFISKTIGTDKTHIIEYELETLKGTRWFEARSGIVKNEKEKSVIILINDITERIKYEKQLKDLIATKDKFFSIIAHDLKNPLHAIMGISEMLYSKTYSNENVVEFAKMLYESGQSANELLENLLEWSRSQTGKISFNPSPQNVAALANETIELLLNHAQNKNIFLQNEIDENIEWKVDKNIVKTILRNLLSNAIKFTQEGGVVKIKAETLTDRLKICVEDNGKGIKPEIIATLFTTSARSTIGTQNEKGSGLGLLLCKELIGIHKGRIYVESTVGEGSKFTFELPA